MKIATWIKISIVMTALCAQANTVRGDGTLNLYYDARKESLDITFRDSRGRIIPAALQKIETFLRSPDDQTHAIDIQLIDLVDAIQDHFQEPVIEIISGYRSPDYNRGLKESGHAVANESLHMQVRAIDIHLDTVTEEAVQDYAQSLNQGGVGWYPQNDFVHVDLGPVRLWGHAENSRKFVGLGNNKGFLIIRSDTNCYFHDNELHVTVTPVPRQMLWRLEKFNRGIWKPVATENSKSFANARFRVPAKILNALPRGRYRIDIGGSLSNEFYLKN